MAGALAEPAWHWAPEVLVAFLRPMGLLSEGQLGALVAHGVDGPLLLELDAARRERLFMRLLPGLLPVPLVKVCARIDACFTQAALAPPAPSPLAHRQGQAGAGLGVPSLAGKLGSGNGECLKNIDCRLW
jgi:hypothetical protein